MKIEFTHFKNLALLLTFSIIIIFTFANCSPDKADVIKVIDNKVNVEDTLINKMIMEVDGAIWESNSTAKYFYANGGIEFDAAKWVDTSKVVETLKFFIKNNKQIGRFYLQNKNSDENFGVFQVYPFSSPIPRKKLTSESGFVNILKQTDSNLVGTFEVILIDTNSQKIIIKNGKFNLKYID
ncbi:MAG: hypothetical protein ACOVNU_03915 [Candidatus Kapaibacteriota bacterium]|jgi:hypothetical protein